MTYARRATGALIAVLAMIGALLVTVPTADAAVTWSPLRSGTSQDITSVDYKGGTTAYVTGGGEIFSGPPNGATRKVNVPGTAFTQVALSPSGTRGAAVGSGDNNGELYVYNGSTWSKADLSASSIVIRSSHDHCKPATPDLAVGPVTNVEFTGVAWSSDQIGYATGNRKTYASSDHVRYVLKTVDGGATWTDVQNRRNGTCLIEELSNTEIAWRVSTTPGLVWLSGSHPNRNEVYRSNNGLATVSGPTRIGLRLHAVDPTNITRQSSAGNTGPAYHQWNYTSDLWQDYIYAGRDQGHDDTKTIRDLKAAPNGWFYIVGDSGLIERTKNGTHAEALPAAGALRSANWRAIGFASSSHAIVGGTNGVLAITSTANQSVTRVAPGLNKKAHKGKGLVKKGKKKYVLRVASRVNPPADVSRAQACTGTAQLVLKGKPAKGKFRNIVKKNATVKADCTITKKLVVKGKKGKQLNRVKPKKGQKLSGVERARLVVKFRGNTELLPTSSKHKIRVFR